VVAFTDSLSMNQSLIRVKENNYLKTEEVVVEEVEEEKVEEVNHKMKEN